MVQIKPSDKKITVEVPYELKVGGQVAATGSISQDVTVEFVKPSRILLGSSTPPSGIDPVKIEANTKALEASLGATLMAHRTYLAWGLTGVNSIAGMKTLIAKDLAAGRAPVTSIKPPGGGWTGWKDVAAGTSAVKQAEVQIAQALQQIAAVGDLPAWLRLYYTFHHEKENDRDLSGLSTTQAQAHRDQGYEAETKHYDRLRAIGVPDNVLMGPTWMNYTLTAEGANKLGPLAKWHQGSDHFDFMSFDDYPTTWDDNWIFSHGQIGRNGQTLPLMFSEYGKSLSEAGGDPQKQADYAQARLDWMSAHRGPDFIGATWWNVVAMKPPTLALMGGAIRAERG